jgi:hypothetical protein
MEAVVCHIRENSRLAWLAARQLRVQRVAVVWRRSIHLYNTSRGDFLNNRPWVLHELCHVAQFQRYGWLRFTLLYLWETLCRGYHGNRYEQEAVLAESEPLLLRHVVFL